MHFNRNTMCIILGLSAICNVLGTHIYIKQTGLMFDSG